MSTMMIVDPRTGNRFDYIALHLIHVFNADFVLDFQCSLDGLWVISILVVISVFMIFLTL